jgi:hypothetical protein
MSAPAYSFSFSSTLPLSACDASPDDDGDDGFSLRMTLEANGLCSCGAMLRIDCTGCDEEDVPQED